MRLESKDASGNWQTWAAAPYDEHSYRSKPIPFGGQACGSLVWRLVLDNHKPLPETASVLVHYTNQTLGREQTVTDQAWSLEAFEIRTFEFTVPESAFSATRGAPSEPKPVSSNQTAVTAQVDHHYLGTCADRGAAP